MIPSQFGDGWLNQQYWTRKSPSIFGTENHYEANCHSILGGGSFPNDYNQYNRNQIVIQTVHWCHHVWTVWSWHLNPLASQGHTSPPFALAPGYSSPQCCLDNPSDAMRKGWNGRKRNAPVNNGHLNRKKHCGVTERCGFTPPEW